VFTMRVSVCNLAIYLIGFVSLSAHRLKFSFSPLGTLLMFARCFVVLFCCSSIIPTSLLVICICLGLSILCSAYMDFHHRHILQVAILDPVLEEVPVAGPMLILLMPFWIWSSSPCLNRTWPLLGDETRGGRLSIEFPVGVRQKAPGTHLGILLGDLLSLEAWTAFGVAPSHLCYK